MSSCIAAHLQKAMSKYGELWDDSALVKALDDAISKYKIMHGKGGDNGSLKEEKITKDTKETAPIFNESYEAKSACMETDDNVTNVPKKTTHTIEAADSSVAEKCTSKIVEQHVSGDEDTHCTYVNAESADHYNLLLNEYNAVEEQRQKLLQQLYQYGNWDSQGYGYGYGHGHDYGYNSQYHTEQTSGQPICCCRPYVCSSSTAPCTSIPHNGTSVSVEADDRFIKAAMEAVDKAIHSLNKETSEGKKGQEVETGSREVAKETTSQTDLSVVLNAWFSAGFYTGKYLSEQASARK